MFTPFSSPRYLTGMSPWSWYCATTTSKRPFRAAGVNALRAGCRNGGGDNADFLVAKEAAFAGMRIESRDRDAGMGDTQGAATLVGEADRGHLRWEIRPADRIGERAVDRHQNGADVVIGEHHRHAHRAASVREDFRVAGIGKSGLSQCFLVDWCRDNSSDCT
jgi:hypothetical protein